MYERNEREKEAEELKLIIDKPELTPEVIWTITERNFILWRRKHDYPRLLKHFSEKLVRFEEWKNEYSLTDQFLISYGLSNCLKPNLHKDGTKYVIQKKWRDEVTKFISFQNLHNKTYRMGPDPVEHKLIKTFLGYIDWANKKKITALKDSRKNENIFYSNAKSNVDSPDIEVMIMGDVKLLKIGGVKVTPDNLGLIKPKYFEFVNADYLVLEGDMATQGRQLTFDYASVDNLTCQNLELPLVNVTNSSMQKLEIIDSNIKQWNFNSSITSGKITNSDFGISNIFGGIFNLDFKDTTINNVIARHFKTTEYSFEKTYQTFKQLYANQGDDKKAVEYFLLEKAIERERIKKEVTNPHISTYFKINKILLFWLHVKHRTINLLKLIGTWTNNLFWGYGRQPLRILHNSILVILLFTLIFYLNRAEIITDSKDISLLDTLYYSTVTFMTLGTNEFNPAGHLKVYVIIEALLGGLCLGFLVGGLSNSKY